MSPRPLLLTLVPVEVVPRVKKMGIPKSQLKCLLKIYPAAEVRSMAWPSAFELPSKLSDSVTPCSCCSPFRGVAVPAGACAAAVSGKKKARATRKYLAPLQKRIARSPPANHLDAIWNCDRCQQIR